MGCGGSKEFDNVYKDYPKLKVHQEDFEKLGLTEKEVGKFYERFLQYKIDGEWYILQYNLVDTDCFDCFD